MTEIERSLCRSCKHFVRVRDVDGPGISWCGNPLTKSHRNPPIGWLSEDAPACELFEDPDRKNESTTDTKLSATLRTEAEQLATFTARLVLHLLVVVVVLGFVLIGVWIHKFFHKQYLKIEQPSVEAVSVKANQAK